MLTLECFNNKNRYIWPEEEIKIYHETHILMNIWKDIILKNSNKKITDLSSGNQEKLLNIIPYLQISFDKNKTLGPQLDKPIVKMILWSSSCVFPNKKLIDQIFEKTKKSIFQYFHHEMLIKAYLTIKEPIAASNIIKHMFEQNHSAYYFAILKYKTNSFSNKVFNDNLHTYRKKATIKLLSKGEKVDLYDVSYQDMIEILNEVKEEMVEDILNN